MNKKSRLGIGALSKATGIHANTIRTWERRYGVPEATRTAGGHRTYDVEVVVHLGLVKRALDLGHRPARIFEMGVDALQELLASTSVPAPSAVAHAVLDAAELGRVQQWMRAVEELDSDGFDRHLLRSLAELGVMGFLERAVTPFLTAVGERWSSGKVSIYHEHFASARIIGFLDAHWRPLSSGAVGPRAVLACLPGEQHVGGLHMAAWVLARRGWRVVFLGANCPALDIVHAVRQSRASAVCVSVSARAEPALVSEQISELLDAAEGVTVIVGGGGAVEHPRVLRLSHLSQLDAWVRR